MIVLIAVYYYFSLGITTYKYFSAPSMPSRQAALIYLLFLSLVFKKALFFSFQSKHFFS